MSEQRLIDANALIPEIKRYFCDYLWAGKGEITKEDKIIINYHRNTVKIIEEAPTVEIPRGEWINEGQLHGCSNCGRYSKEYNKPFCCHCGADMRGVNKNEERQS